MSVIAKSREKYAERFHSLETGRGTAITFVTTPLVFDSSKVIGFDIRFKTRSEAMTLICANGETSFDIIVPFAVTEDDVLVTTMCMGCYDLAPVLLENSANMIRCVPCYVLTTDHYLAEQEKERKAYRQQMIDERIAQQSKLIDQIAIERNHWKHRCKIITKGAEEYMDNIKVEAPHVHQSDATAAFKSTLQQCETKIVDATERWKAAIARTPNCDF
jgi:hypothetical protein